MLSNEQKTSVLQAIMLTAEAMGETVSANAAAIMTSDLSEYPLQSILSALKLVRQECKGRLALADILKRIQVTDGRPGANEAWAIAMLASDESATIVMTDEIAAALNIARPILAARDKVGARVAFIESYERITREARADGRPVNWFASIGFDAAQRDQAIKDAVVAGRLTSEYADRLGLPEPITEAGSQIAGLLTGGAVSRVAPPPEVLAKLEEISTAMRRQNTERLEQFQAEALERHGAIEAARNDAIEKVGALMREASA